jgi:hypothetical protein
VVSENAPPAAAAGRCRRLLRRGLRRQGAADQAAEERKNERERLRSNALHDNLQ